MVAKTLANALDLLNYFTHETPVWGVRELAAASGIAPTIIQRTFKTFASRGFLVKDPQTQKYALGIRFFELGVQYRDRFHFADLIDPLMKELASLSGETVFLTLLVENQGVCAALAETSNSIRFTVKVGTRFPLYAGANGKAILTHLPHDTQEKILGGELKAFTANTITDSEKLRADLALIRQQGWSESSEEFMSNTFGVAIPLFSTTGSVVGSLSISGPSFRKDAIAVPELVANMQAIKKRLECYLSAQADR